MSSILDWKSRWFRLCLCRCTIKARALFLWNTLQHYLPEIIGVEVIVVTVAGEVLGGNGIGEGPGGYITGGVLGWNVIGEGVNLTFVVNLLLGLVLMVSFAPLIYTQYQRQSPESKVLVTD